MRTVARAVGPALVILLVACASAHACSIVGPSKAPPATFLMTPNTPLIISGSTTTRTLPAERVFVEFALMRIPPSAQFGGTCWAANGSVDAQFESRLVAAWRMAGTIRDSYPEIDLKSIESDPLSLDELAFAPVGPGVLADASRSLSPVQPTVRCERETLAALADAVRVGIAKAKNVPVRALVDYHQNLYDPRYLCAPDLRRNAEVGRSVSGTPAVREQVLVVP